MNDTVNITATDLDQADVETLTYDVSDETLESAAAAERTGHSMTLSYYSCGSCPR